MSYAANANHRLLVFGIALLCLVGMTARWATGDDAPSNETAARLVEEAQQAESDGDAARRFALLRQAVRIAPDYELARWQLGQVQVDGEWLAVEEAQHRAAANPKQAEYRELRAKYGESPQGQLALARWCRKHELDEEARFHWASVLSVDPNHEEALRAVDMRWHNGRLLSREEIAEQRAQLRESKRVAKKWKTAVARWRRAVSSNDPIHCEAALDEIRSLTDSNALLALEELTLGRDASRNASDDCRQISLALVEALGKMPEHEATRSLVRHAVWSPAEDVRQAAIETLKPRPLHDYVPILLSGLAMPIESSFYMKTEPDGSVYYTHSLYREGAESDFAIDTRLSAVQHDLGGRRYTRVLTTNRIEAGPPTGAEPASLAHKAEIAHRAQRRFGNVAATAESQVAQANYETEMRNARIIEVLEQTTGLALGSEARRWWEWWREENEYYAPVERPVETRYHADTQSYYHGQPAYDYRMPGESLPSGTTREYKRVAVRPPVRPRIPPRNPWGPRPQTSCFAKGTTVWTKTGQRPIESLELGELVLAQDVATGELAYQPVIARTVRPPSEIVKLRLSGGELRTTLGHPLWVAGVGWRMAKELGDGAILHAVTGSPRVESIAEDGEEEAYNLVVAEFNTYFVGERGILVHDNTPRRPTRAAIPGLAAR